MMVPAAGADAVVVVQDAYVSIPPVAEGASSWRLTDPSAREAIVEICVERGGQPSMRMRVYGRRDDGSIEWLDRRPPDGAPDAVR